MSSPVLDPIGPLPPTRPQPRGGLRRTLGPLAAAVAAVAKFGAVLLKVKAVGVVLTMLVSVATYTLLWGWRFAAGFVALLFVHEMGHVIVLRRRGIPASAPLFIPFLGAFVSMKQAPRSAVDEAASAIAGPAVGTLGAAATAVAGHLLGSPLLIALAFTGFFLNLFNLLPALPLDGGRVAAALHPAVWLLGLVTLLAVEVWRPSPVIPIILILGGVELLRRWRGRRTASGRAYYALSAGQRAAVAAAYVGLIGVLVVAMHLTYVPRSL